jgi:hypothetical protein
MGGGVCHWVRPGDLVCSVLASRDCDKIPEKSKVGMIYFGLVSEVWIQSHVDPLLWA